MKRYPIRFGVKEEIPDEVWEAARDACAAGVPLKAIAKRAGIYEAWVEERAADAGWMTPERKASILREYELQMPEKVREAVDDIALATAALSSDKAILHRAKVAELTEKKLREATNIKAPQNWKDLQILDNMARKSLGLEDDSKPAAMIQMNLLNTTAEVEREA
jgi:hypothetical protein